MSKAGQERVLSLRKFLKLQGKFHVFKLSHLGVGKEIGSSSSLRTILEKELDNEHGSTESGERTDYKNIQNRPEAGHDPRQWDQTPNLEMQTRGQRTGL